MLDHETEENSVLLTPPTASHFLRCLSKITQEGGETATASLSSRGTFSPNMFPGLEESWMVSWCHPPTKSSAKLDIIAPVQQPHRLLPQCLLGYRLVPKSLKTSLHHNVFTSMGISQWAQVCEESCNCWNLWAHWVTVPLDNSEVLWNEILGNCFENCYSLSNSEKCLQDHSSRRLKMFNFFNDTMATANGYMFCYGTHFENIRLLRHD